MIQIIFHFLPVSYHGADQIKVLRENATLFAEGLGDRPGVLQLTSTGGEAGPVSAISRIWKEVRMRKRNVFQGILGLVILAVSAAPARGGGLTLKECLQAALADNPSFKESLLAVSASERGVESAEGRRFPRLSFDASQVFRQDALPYIPAQSATIGPHFSDTFSSWGATLSMPLYQGGQITKGIELAKIRMEIQEHAAGLTKNDLIADTVNTYNKILQLTAFRESERASVAALEEQEQNVRLLVDVGRAATVDLLKVEVQLANERQRLLTLEESLSILQATLRFLMGEKAGEIQDPLVLSDFLTRPAVRADFPSGIAEARFRRPEYLLAAKGVDEAAAVERITFGKLLPSVSAATAYIDQVGFDPWYQEANWSVGINLNIPLFDKSIRADLARDRIGREKAKERLQAVDSRIRLDIQSALASLTDSASRIDTAQKAVSQADESFRIERLKYGSGAGTMADLLLAQAADITAAANYTQALYDYNAAVVAYRRASGTLEEYLK
jgi:outer membrane protein TolC